jgi:hypothetical protein
MARSVDTIFQGMLQYVAGSATLSSLLSTTISTEQELLDKLSSTSRVAIWVLMFYVVAKAINTFEQLMDVFRAEIDETIANNVYGTERWWVTWLKLFQYGDTLTFVNDQPGYATVTPANRIITAAACVPGSNGAITLKTAKTSGGALVALSGAEVTAAQAYVNLITPAGVYPTVTTADADELKLTATVYVDPQVINLADGSLLSDSSVYPVEDAINAYLSTFSNVNFNGQINLSHVKDAVQAVAGVNDFVISTAEVDAGSGYTPIGRLYQCSSGYIIEGTGAGNAFSDTFTYIAGN